MTTIDRPAGIERVIGGIIEIAYRDDLGFSGNRIAGIMHTTFGWKPATGALLLDCLDMNNHPLCMDGATRTGSLLSGHPLKTHGSILARPVLK